MVAQSTISRVMRELGQRGGKARLTKMTPEQRSAVSRAGAIKRWEIERARKPLGTPNAASKPTQ